MDSFHAIPSPLYRWDFEHDACGVGFVANMHGHKSYDIIDRGIAGLRNLAHRGAIDADAITGDGAGILTQIPYELFRKYLQENGKHLYNDEDLAVCVLFLPGNDSYAQSRGKHHVEDASKREGLQFLAWRDVPVDPTCLGKKAVMTMPKIVQALVARGPDMDDDAFERHCFLAMKTAEAAAIKDSLEDFYVVSFSSKTVTYKGLLNAPQVRKFFVDLKAPEYRSAFVIFHQRFATNTLPDWRKAQPFRMMAHNGEINTIRGNRNLMRAREYSDAHGVWGDRFADLRPVIQDEMSDSASFDNALQVMTVAGRSCIHGVSMMMPTAWEKDDSIEPAVRDFYRYHSTIIEPWDGPAAITFTDGRFVGASLDRNGLRPLRYKVYDDGVVVVGSEVGIVPEWGAKCIRNGRLGPGRMIAVDIKDSRILEDDQIKHYLAGQDDYGAWCTKSLHNLAEQAPMPERIDATLGGDELTTYQAAFGIDTDERELLLVDMANKGKEPLGSMGDDTPLAVFSRRPRLLYTYFKQLFAQVTNPAIDPYREALVMSINMYLGGRFELFDQPSHTENFIALESPLLFRHEFEAIRKIDGFAALTEDLDTTFAVAAGPDGLEPALADLSKRAVGAARGGKRILVLSDRGISSERAPIPMLLAVGRIHHDLVRAGLRLRCDIVCDTGEVRDNHQLACLLGFGANAVHPYLALDLVLDSIAKEETEDGIDAVTGLANYKKAMDAGLYKIMSKMGISTLFSYQGAQIFEAIGLSNKVVDECFYQTATPIGGIGYEHIASETLARHAKAFSAEGDVEIESEGYYTVKKRGEGEVHGWSPKVVSGMNRFNNPKKGGDYEAFEAFKTASDDHAPVSIKDLLKLRYTSTPVAIDEVEPVEDIRNRFTTAAMSLGALSPEAHEALAIAMNRIGGKSNSGEGGEDPIRFHPFENGDNANSAIKQVASGRFGVTAEYLANAKEIEIKVAQGAKPGEGGQLMGLKVSELIARLRFCKPGTTLISPPPHHDIYSIEDLAQLIFDLKECNPRAKVCVKLVSCSGVGTVAAGVAKAYADVILISGHDGGTGASPLASIKNAGSAWEIGLAEAHQVLMMNDLRSRVTLRTDGGMKTGKDIVTAAILGAEEFNFGTAALIAAGCAMFRVCHLNSCPVGVATQRDDLRAKFRGKPENVVNYFNAVSEDVRRYLSKLGYRKLDEIIGRTELLEQITDPSNPKSTMVNFAGLLHNPDPTGEMDRIHRKPRNDSPGHEGSLDHQILQDAKEAIMGNASHFVGDYKVRNTNRNIGTRLSGEIGYLKGNNGLQDGTLDLTFRGSCGQSFGCFLVKGMRLKLIGEANDYVGKGMNGGEIIVRPDENAKFVWHDNIIMGNTCLYGATGGELFCAGKAGERFGVRNSGAVAVVGGVGDHGCEYMTRGTVVILGEVGRNFGSGMSGGLAFILDERNDLDKWINPEMITLEKLFEEQEIASLKNVIARHVELTGSPRGTQILDSWDEFLPKFAKVVPKPALPDQEPEFFRYGVEKLDPVTV